MAMKPGRNRGTSKSVERSYRKGAKKHRAKHNAPIKVADLEIDSYYMVWLNETPSPCEYVIVKDVTIHDNHSGAGRHILLEDVRYDTPVVVPVNDADEIDLPARRMKRMNESDPHMKRVLDLAAHSKEFRNMMYSNDPVE